MSKIDLAAAHYATGERLMKEVHKESNLSFDKVVEKIDRRKKMFD